MVRWLWCLRIQFDTHGGIQNGFHFFLVLPNQDFQHLPLENLPSLEGQFFTRHLSFHCMMGQFCSIKDNCNSVVKSGVDKRNTYYVLNPDNNLENTQARFQDWFGKWVRSCRIICGCRFDLNQQRSQCLVFETRPALPRAPSGRSAV